MEPNTELCSRMVIHGHHGQMSVLWTLISGMFSLMSLSSQMPVLIARYKFLTGRRNYVFWTDSGRSRGDKINRAWLNGTQATALLTGIPNSGTIIIIAYRQPLYCNNEITNNTTTSNFKENFEARP